MNSVSSKWVDFSILTCAFLLVAHSFSAPDDVTFASYGEASGTGTLGKQFGFALLLLYVVFALRNLRYRSFCFSSTWSARFAVAFFLLVTLSIAWSTDRHTSIVRWIGFATYVVAGMIASVRLGKTDTIRWYVFALSSFVILGLLVELIRGTFHPFSAGYRFGGINVANATGSESVILAFASLAAMRVAPLSRSRLYPAALVVAFGVLLLTRSRTALICLVASLAIVYGIVYLRSVRLALFFYGSALLLSLPFVLSSAGLLNLDQLLSVGRSDASGDALTGRVPLWTELYEEYVTSRPVLGFGYGAFWTPGRIEKISYDQQWNIAAAHSSYLDAVLSLGVPGGLLYVMVILTLLARALRLARRSKPEGFFFACLLVSAIIDGATESETWYLSSIYLFATVQAVFVLNLVESQNSSQLPVTYVLTPPLR